MSHRALIAEVQDWLVGKALADPDIVPLFERLCDRLRSLGIPVDRAVLSWPTLHPLFHAEQIFWRHGEGAVLEQYYHSSAGSEAYRRSPFTYIYDRGIPLLRRRLSGDGAVTDFDVLVELSEKGFTDYLLVKTEFGIARVPNDGLSSTGVMASWSTKRPGGFADDDLEALQHIQRLMSVACRAAIQQRVMTNLGQAYLGVTAAGRVLEGDIKRGDGDRISAIVWFSDLRGSTKLSDTMDPDDYLALLNRYFECTAQPVIDHGGEVLNFIGDGVMAIFPVTDAGAEDAARRAEAAARDSLRRHAETDGPAFRYGIGLALGQVMFGNIGVPGRLAFSAIGQVVNQVQRVEKATERLGTPILATASFAKLSPDNWEPAGKLDGQEFAGGVRLFMPVAEAFADEIPAEAAE